MKKTTKTFFFATSIVLTLYLVGCGSNKTKQVVSDKITSPKDLENHTQEFKKEIIKVTDGVYVAIGYGLANSILIEGKDSVVIVDVLESMQAAAEVQKAFAKISAKPVKALIYTHYHPDHVYGAQAFVGKGNKVAVYAHETTPRYLDEIATVTREIHQIRSLRMFGVFLDQKALVNAGIGEHLHIDEGATLGLIRPTHLFAKTLSVNLAGVSFELIHAPGETDDQIFVWLPEKKVMLCGDNYYKTFPNLYTIRGTRYRDPMQWVNSLDIIRQKMPEFLVPSHTRPLLGKEKIYQTITDYRDAIQYIHDQTVRGMNKGFTPDELVTMVKLPKHLAEKPYLQEFYGTVAWSVRNVFNGYIGFFDGNPSTLLPLAPKEKAARMAKLAGGEKQLLQQCQQAVSQKDWQWALELTDYLMRLDVNNNTYKDLRIQALTALGEQQSNPNARHYYLTHVLELKGLKNDGNMVKNTAEVAHDVPLHAIFKALAVHLNADKSANTNTKVVFDFPDEKAQYTLWVRYGVAEVQPFAMEKPDLKVVVNGDIWKEIVARLRSPLWAYTNGQMKIEGSSNDFKAFMDLFQE